jgi:hypothetical protein
MIAVNNSIKMNYIVLFTVLTCSSIKIGAKTIEIDSLTKQIAQKELQDSVRCKIYIWKVMIL